VDIERMVRGVGHKIQEGTSKIAALSLEDVLPSLLLMDESYT
jgi:hypothetical protein